MLSAYFLTHATTEAKLSTRTFYNSVAIDLAEAGVDYAMLDINNSALTTANSWRAATDNAASWVKSFGGVSDTKYNLGQGTGTVYVRVDNWTAATSNLVTITSCGCVAINKMPAIYRQLIVKVRKRPMTSAGMLAKGAIDFGGGTTADSYDSSIGVPSSTNRSDTAMLATASVTSRISTGQSLSVYGYVSTAGHVMSTTDLGVGGRIYGATTAAGVTIDPTRVRTDFSQNIPDTMAPTGAPIVLAPISATTTLPRVGDTPNNGTRFLYNVSSISLTNSNLTITGPVDLVVDGAFSMNALGTSQLAVTSVSGSLPSLGLYIKGAVTIDGNGIVNSTNIPSKCMLYGTGNAAWIINMHTAVITAVIYAPNSTVNTAGDGQFTSINGAITANMLTYNCGGAFHYDIQLGGMPSPYYGVKSWVELTDWSASTSPFKRDNRDPFTFL